MAVSFGSYNSQSLNNYPFCSSDFLDSTHIVIGYGDVSNATAQVFEVSGTTIGTAGTASVAKAINVNSLDIFAMDATHFVMIYSTSGNMYARAASVSGTTITWGAEFGIFSYGGAVRGCKMASNNFMVHAGYSATGGLIYNFILTGVTITNGGNQSTGWSGVREQLGVCRLTDTLFAVSFVASGENSVRVLAGTIPNGGGAPTLGSSVALTAASTQPQNTFITAMDATHFIVSSNYYNGTNNILRLAAGSIATRTITMGTEATFVANIAASSSEPAPIFRKSDTQFLCFYSGLDTYMYMVSGSLSGTTLTDNNDEARISAASVAERPLHVRASSDSLRMALSDYEQSYYGRTRIGQILMGPTNMKTFDDLAAASVKTYNNLTIESVKTLDGLT